MKILYDRTMVVDKATNKQVNVWRGCKTSAELANIPEAKYGDWAIIPGASGAETWKNYAGTWKKFTGLVDTSDADAVAGNIVTSKTAYVQGVKVVGTHA